MSQIFEHALVGEKSTNDSTILGAYTLISSTQPLYDGIYNNEVEIIWANETQKRKMRNRFGVEVKYAIQSGIENQEILFSALISLNDDDMFCGRNIKGQRIYRDIFLFEVQFK